VSASIAILRSSHRAEDLPLGTVESRAQSRMPARISSERWRVVIPYLDAALELDESGRAAWLDALRRQDGSLADDVAVLLEKHDLLDAQGYLDAGIQGHSRPTSLAGQVLGAYTLREQLGQGGMGTVWLADRTDGRYQGTAAVKLLNPSLVGREGEGRFRREGSILARLRHPNIAQLIDAGVSDTGQPYLVLEHVDGLRIDRYCDARGLGVDARVRLFLDVLSAVAHAHASLVVHRDLKPSNVMVGEDGRVKLLDFGIAKLLERDAAPLTSDGAHLMTPQYAAPEQLTGGDISTATDVYSLGGLLYVLLTGCHPTGRKTGSPAELVRAIVDAEPPRSSDAVLQERPGAEAPAQVAARRGITAKKLSAALRGDLDNVMAKALKKQPTERYASAEAMADDLRRYLDHRPVLARKDSLGYRARKFVARNRVGLAAAGVAVAALVTGTAVAVWQARQAAAERDRALVELQRSEATNALASFLLAEARPSGGRPLSNAELLARGEALVERRFATEPALQAHLFMGLSELHHENEQFDRWQATIHRAFALSRELPDVGLRSRSACLKAAALDDLGQVAEADQVLAAALADLDGRADGALDEIVCRVCEANMAARRGDAPRTVAAAERAVALEDARSGTAGRGFEALFLLATGYYVSQRSAESDATYGRLAAMLERQGLGETRHAAFVYSNWSTMLQGAGQYLRAAEMSSRAYDVARHRDSEQGAPTIILRTYSNALCAVGRCREATALADEAVAKAVAAGSPRRRVAALTAAAGVHAGAGDLDGADRMLTESEALLESCRKELPEQPSLIERRRAQVALLRGDPRRALALVERAAAGPHSSDVVPLLLVQAQAQNEAGAFAAARASAERASEDGAAWQGLPFSSWAGQIHLERGIARAGEGDRTGGREEVALALRHLQATLGPDAAPTRRAVRALAGLTGPGPS
jgi:eukaryotic-like serine/threonine-protein kinase